jgi:His/Glu/Gln/Arg/opine family amino acid ABC transporter permease subunit
MVRYDLQGYAGGRELSAGTAKRLLLRSDRRDRLVTANDYLSIAHAALATASMAVVSIVFGVPIGLGLALIRWSRLPLLNRLTIVYVSIVRTCPSVTLALLIFFALPEFGISMDPLTAGILTLTLSTAAFNTEIWRSALMNFPRDQYDAALSLGMRRVLRFRRVILPQIVRSSLPALVNEMTLQVKSTPAVAVLGIVDITRAAIRVGARTYDPLPPFIVALVLYSMIVFAFVKTQRVIERRYAQADAG